MQKNITIVDIAKEAGVSISTVSRVLTGNARVKEEKKQRIQQIINKYDFHPNMLARGLINTKTHVIGILCADIRNPYYAALCVTCEQAANENGYNIMLCNSFGDRLKEFELLDNLARQRVDAIILLGGAADDLVTDHEYAEKVNTISDQIPVVITGRLDGTPCSRINIDATEAMTQVMNYISTIPSFKKIAFAGGRSDVIFTVGLRACFRKMLRQLKLEYIPEFDVTNLHYDETGGLEAMDTILSHGKPDVVICVNDFTAVGVLKSLSNHHLKVPQDISVISFDDTFISTLTTPHLTSISYNYVEFGNQLIESAINLINGKSAAAETLIHTTLVIRDSCIKGA